VQHTSSEVLIFQFWVPIFSENVFQSAVELCCQIPVAPVHHFSTVTGPKCLAVISPFSNFLSFTSLGTIFLFSFSVPTESVECSIFSFLANSGLLKKSSIHSVCPRPNKGSRSSSTTAAVSEVSGVIRLDCRTVILPVYTRKHHKYPVLDSCSFQTLKPLVVGAALLTDAPSSLSSFHHWQCFGLIDTEFEILCSNDISQDKF